MSQLRFDRSSLIINVGLLPLLLKSLFQSLPQQHELALTSTPDGKSKALPSPPFFCLSNYPPLHYFSLFFCELWIVSEGSLFFFYLSLSLCCFHTFLHLNMHTHILDWLPSLQSGRDTVVGMCHSFIIDQIQLPSSTTDHSEQHHCFSLSRTHTETHRRVCLSESSVMF